MDKKKKGREIERDKISKNWKYERLALSHLLGYFPGMPYWTKKRLVEIGRKKIFKKKGIRKVGPEPPAWILCWDSLMGKMRKGER